MQEKSVHTKEICSPAVLREVDAREGDASEVDANELNQDGYFDCPMNTLRMSPLCSTCELVATGMLTLKSPTVMFFVCNAMLAALALSTATIEKNQVGPDGSDAYQ